jgi:hypothetical protein
MAVDLGASRALEISHYCLRHGFNCDDHILCNWDLEGQAGDGATAWVTLRQHRGDMTIRQAGGTGYAKVGAWPVENAGKQRFRAFRVVTQGNNSDGYNVLMCAGIELYG